MYIIKLIILNLYKINIKYQCLFLESELVSGFMTEHAAVIFVFFFLAEYASIVLICILTSILFLGGYLYNYISLFWLTQYFDLDYFIENHNQQRIILDPLLEGLVYGFTLGLNFVIWFLKL